MANQNKLKLPRGLPGTIRIDLVKRAEALGGEGSEFIALVCELGSRLITSS